MAQSLPKPLALDTSNVPENGNLYFTEERVDDRVAALLVAGTGITLSYDDPAGTITISSTAVGGVSSVFGRTGVVTAQSGDYNTSQVSENTNLYYTQGRFDSAFAAKSTSDLAEGSNLFFTDERVDDRVSNLLVAGANITLTYNDSLNTLTVASTASGGGLDLVSYSYAGGL